MKKLVLALVLTGVAAPAFAQYVVIEPDVREYVIREAPSVSYDYDYEDDIAVGAVLPGDVEIFDIEDPEIEADYGYTILDEQPVIVEPRSRRIIQILD